MPCAVPQAELIELMVDERFKDLHNRPLDDLVLPVEDVDRSRTLPRLFRDVYAARVVGGEECYQFCGQK